MTDPLARARLEKLAQALGPLDAWPAIHSVYGTPISGDLGEVDLALAADLTSLLADSLPREGERERIARIVAATVYDLMRAAGLSVNVLSTAGPILKAADQIMGRDDG